MCSIEAGNFASVNILPCMIEARARSVIACVKDEVYVFDGGKDSVEKYSLTTKTWKYLSCKIDHPNLDFQVCSFMDSVYLIGGFSKGGYAANECTEFNTKTRRCREIAGMVRRARCLKEGSLFRADVGTTELWKPSKRTIT